MESVEKLYLKKFQTFVRNNLGYKLYGRLELYNPKYLKIFDFLYKGYANILNVYIPNPKVFLNVKKLIDNLYFDDVDEEDQDWEARFTKDFGSLELKYETADNFATIVILQYNISSYETTFCDYFIKL